MSYDRPGVYVQETLNPIQPTTGPNSNTIGAFVGPNDRGPVVPTLVSSWSDYVNNFGSWNTTASNDLPLALYMFFANGGRQAYVNRVVGSGAASAARTLLDGASQNTLTLTAVNPGTWSVNSGSYYGISFSVTAARTSGYFDLSIYFGGQTNAYLVEKFTDISMTVTDPRYAVSVINAGSRYVVATDAGSSSTGSTRNPVTVSVSSGSLTGGANGASVTSITSYSAFDTINNSLLLNVAGFTDSTTINAAIAYANGRGDVFVIVDGIAPGSSTETTATTTTNQLSTAASYTTSSNAAVYYPRIVIADPTIGVGGAVGATKLVGPGGAVAGLYVSTDNSRGVFKAPAGLQTRVANAVSVAALTNSQLDSLNSASAAVNAIKFVPGSGIVVMGARTLDASYISKYVPVRRTLIYLEKSLSDLTQFAIFEPNDQALWRRLSATVSGFLTNFWSQGGLSGTNPNQAFFVKIDSTNNTSATIANGEVHIEVGVALQRPAEFIVIKIGQFDGGTTVTVA